MNRRNLFIASPLGNDPHTEGIRNAMKIAEAAGIETMLIPPALDYEAFCDAIHLHKPRFVGLSYRQNPEVGVAELEKIISHFKDSGLINEKDGVKICFAGLPQTIRQLQDKVASLPLKVDLVMPREDAFQQAIDTVDFFEIKSDRDRIVRTLKEELIPKGIDILDQIADEVIVNDDYKNEPPLRVPSESARKDFSKRIDESDIPVLRTHFGIPDKTVIPTVEGIRKLAEMRVVDEISLGSSDLSQRYFGHPEMFDKLKNDGGVPYKDAHDLSLLFQASRCGNYPAVKPYCHVTDIVGFIDTCLQTGALIGAHQAIPLFWFNELDGRGPATVRDSIKEHFAAVKKLASLGIPTEMNDPNQWSSRLAHDTIIVTSYALISAVMTMCGVRNMVCQMQLNKPKETGDYADLAKMGAGMEMARIMSTYEGRNPRIIRETRTGIESLSANMEHAKWQLGRSTLLQMCLSPDIIHIVSYCEANYAARPEDIIDSSRLVRRAVKLFNENKEDILNSIDKDIVNQRKEYLLRETEFLLREIAKLNPQYPQSEIVPILTPYVANAAVLATAIEKHIISSPGIINQKYKGQFITKPMKYGMINLVDSFVNPTVITEADRLRDLIIK